MICFFILLCIALAICLFIIYLTLADIEYDDVKDYLDKLMKDVCDDIENNATDNEKGENNGR